jgi:hypothetical protein
MDRAAWLRVARTGKVSRAGLLLPTQLGLTLLNVPTPAPGIEAFYREHVLTGAIKYIERTDVQAYVLHIRGSGQLWVLPRAAWAFRPKAGTDYSRIPSSSWQVHRIVEPMMTPEVPYHERSIVVTATGDYANGLGSPTLYQEFLREAARV